MERQVIFRDKQEFQAADLNNAQSFVSDSIGDIVSDAVSNQRHYAGFAVTQESATSVKVAPGRLYQAGAVYISPDEQSLNLFAYLPLVTKKKLAVVAWGQEIDTDVQPRDFLIDLTSGATEPQAVAMEHRRAAQVNVVAGVESPDPQAPLQADNTVLVALITMTPTGIETIEMQGAAKLPQLLDHQGRVITLEAWKRAAEPRISSIATDLSALASKTDGLASKQNLVEMASDLARVKAKLNLPATYASYESDYFGDESKSDKTVAGYAANVKNGLLFPYAGRATAPLALFNPYDASIIRSSRDLVLPKYISVPRIQTSGYSGDVSLSQYQVQTQTIRQYTETVWDYVYGWNWNYSPYWYNSYYWYYYGYYYGYYSYYGYWTSHQETRYALETATTSINGTIVAQTVLVPNAMWLTQLGLFFTQAGASGDVTVVICETDGGKPNLQKTLASVTVPVANLKRYPTETQIPIPAVLLSAGTRYAICIITQGNHRVATVSGNNYTQGTLFFGTDGDYFTGDLTKDLMFSLYGAQFAVARTEVQLQPVSLAGGITDLAISAQQVVPDGCELQYEIQVGGKWYALGDQALVLQSAPDIVPLRAVLLGTSDLAGVHPERGLRFGQPARALDFPLQQGAEPRDGEHEHHGTGGGLELERR